MTDLDYQPQEKVMAQGINWVTHLHRLFNQETPHLLEEHKHQISMDQQRNQIAILRVQRQLHLQTRITQLLQNN